MAKHGFETMGVVRSHTETVINPFDYSAGYEDSTGLVKLGARFFDPMVGRFTQQDPSDQETNLYAYTGGDPINELDPAGRSIASVQNDIVGAVIAGNSLGEALSGLSTAQLIGLGYGAAFEAGCELAVIALGIATGAVGLAAGLL
jgi:RHS repeat-associated protein